MIKKILGFTKLFATVVIFATAACNSGSSDTVQKTDGTKTKEKAALTFVDSSKGLPSKGQWRQRIWISDINRDGKVDILAPPPRKASKDNKKPVVWYGNDGGQWTRAQLNLPPDTEYNYGAVAVSDFDGDKTLDIAFAMHEMPVRVLKRTGDGGYVDFSKGIPPIDELRSRAVVSADFDNDGVSDLAFASEWKGEPKDAVPKGIWVCFRDDKGWKCNPAGDEDEVRDLFADQLTTGDINGDGNRDIALASLVISKSLVVWLGDGKGGFTPFNGGLPKDMFYLQVALADIDGDGRDDFITAICGKGRKGFMGLKAFLSRPDGFEEISEGLPVQVAFLVLDACDLDNDGSPEIVGGTGKGGLKIFSRKGDVWREVNVSGLPGKGLTKPYGVYCRDMNGDGLNDIVMNYASERLDQGGIRVFFNTANKKSGANSK